jgi:large subunit ribosomal protein LP0
MSATKGSTKPKSARKVAYFDQLVELLDTYKKVLVVEADNVGSNHMQKIRQSTRGEAVLLMGKKTMMRCVVRQHAEKNPNLEALVPHLHGNVGLVFTDKDMKVVRDKLTSLKVSAPAKAGSFAPNDVIVPAGNTGMEPTQTSFLQALNIASKINKGQVEIISDVQLLKKGDKVGPSEATLLSKLNIKPFMYGLVPRTVYDDGAVYDQSVLDMEDSEVIAKFSKAVATIAAFGLEFGYPTVASVPHSMSRGFRNLLALAFEGVYTFPQAEKVKTAMANAPTPSAAPAAAPAGKKEEPKKEKKEEPKKEEPKVEEEEDGDMGLDLFG